MIRLHVRLPTVINILSTATKSPALGMRLTRTKLQIKVPLLGDGHAKQVT